MFNIDLPLNMLHHLDGHKGRNHMIIPLDPESSFGNCYHHFIIEVIKSIKMMELYLNIIKGIPEQIRDNIILN